MRVGLAVLVATLTIASAPAHAGGLRDCGLTFTHHFEIRVGAAATCADGRATYRALHTYRGAFYAAIAKAFKLDVPIDGAPTTMYCFAAPRAHGEFDFRCHSHERRQVVNLDNATLP